MPKISPVYIPAALLGGVSLYNFARAIGYNNNVKKQMTKGKPVTDEQIKKMLGGMKGVEVLRDPEDVDRYFKHHHFARRALRKITEHSSNAFAGKTKKGDFMIIPRKVSLEVAAHEIGHLKDFAAKKIKLEKHDPYYHTDSMWHATGRLLWKPKFVRDIIGMEENAWKNVPPSHRKEETKREALKSYHQSYHVGRGALSANLALIAGMLGFNFKTIARAAKTPVLSGLGRR